MKKYINRLFIAFISAMALVSCSEDEGTVPGNDNKPVVTIYQYTPGRPYSADNDLIVRFAANNQTEEAYYLVEKTADKNTQIASVGEEGYMERVVSNGVRLSGISGESNVDVTLTDLYGDYTITAVAVGKSTKTATEITFSGLDWTDVVSGTYYFAFDNVTGMSSRPTVLQVCTTDANLYRFKDVFETGYHLKIELIDYKDTDADGEYQFFRIPATDTPFTYGDYGTVYVRDIGYWYSEAYVTEYGYESGMYEDYNCFLCIQYYVTAGNLGFTYDFFIVD